MAPTMTVVVETKEKVDTSTVEEKTKEKVDTSTVVEKTKEKEDTAVVVEQPTKEQMVEAGNKIEDAFNDLRAVKICQKTEKIEAASQYIFCGCCKIETENRYIVKSLDTGETRLVAMEDSWWCLRNPCICCDCIYWRCHR